METEKLKRKSRQGAMISSAGLIVILAVFVYASLQVNKLNKSIEKKTVELTALDSVINSQNEEIEANKTVIANLVEEINKLRDPTIQPHARAVEIPGVKDPQGRQVYDFTLWITSSQVTLNRISKVSYQFGNETFLLKKRESEDNTNGFLVSYRGWGCLTVVKLTVLYDDGETETVYFNMCEELMWV